MYVVQVQRWETDLVKWESGPEQMMRTYDRWCARRLPDDFVARPGDPVSRISKIVAENWWEYEGADLARLTELLLPILQPLTHLDGKPPDELRDQCVEMVEQWLAEIQAQASE
jgi:hypothetical protein